MPYFMSFKEEVLGALESFGEMSIRFMMHRLSIQNMHYPTNYYATLQRLVKKGFVRKKKIGRTVSVSITALGKQQLKKKPDVKKRTDGLLTIIIFDIPEEKRRARENFRRYLLRNGFTLIQESVLVSSNYPTQEIKDLIGELGIAQNITMILGKIDHGWQKR